MRCVACDCILRQGEIAMIKDDDTPEDMCSDCRGISYSAEFLDIHEYQHQHLTELLDLYNYIADSHKES